MTNQSQIADQAEFMALGLQRISGPNLAQAQRYMEHIAEELDEIDAAITQDDAVKLVDGLFDLAVVTLGALISLLGEEHAEQAWDAVSGANLRKVDGTHGPVRWRDDKQIGKPEGWNGPESELAQIIIDSGLRDAIMAYQAVED